MRLFTTSVIVLHPTESAILFVRHPKFDMWVFPGGKVESDEAPHTAAIREIEEEVGLDVALADYSMLPRWVGNGNSRLPQPIAMIEERLPDGTGFYVDLIYVGIVNDTLIKMRSEVSEARWLDRDTVADLDTFFPIKNLALEVFNRRNEFKLRP